MDDHGRRASTCIGVTKIRHPERRRSRHLAVAAVEGPRRSQPRPNPIRPARECAVAVASEIGRGLSLGIQPNPQTQDPERPLPQPNRRGGQRRPPFDPLMSPPEGSVSETKPPPSLHLHPPPNPISPHPAHHHHPRHPKLPLKVRPSQQNIPKSQQRQHRRHRIKPHPKRPPQPRLPPPQRHHPRHAAAKTAPRSLAPPTRR